jgi:hypothetical protein
MLIIFVNNNYDSALLGIFAVQLNTFAVQSSGFALQLNTFAVQSSGFALQPSIFPI